MTGLWHVRGGPAATLMLVLVLALVVALSDILILVDAVYDQADRPLGTFELAAMVLASVLPALTAPSLDGRERLAHGPPRMAHTAVTLAVFLAPLFILPVWNWRVRLDPLAELPPVVGFTGNLILFSAIGMVLLLLGGRTASVLATPVLCIGFIVGQQVYPGSVLTDWWAHPDLGWHSSWTVVVVLTLLVTALAWARGSVPRR